MVRPGVTRGFAFTTSDTVKKILHGRMHRMETADALAKVGERSDCVVAFLTSGRGALFGLRNYTKKEWQDRSVWTSPGGRCDAGETLEEALSREVQEEVGITDLTIEDFIGEVPGAKEGDTLHLFYVTTSQDAKLMEPEKFSEWKWVPLDEYVADDAYGGFNAPARAMVIGFLRSLRVIT